MNSILHPVMSEGRFRGGTGIVTHIRDRFGLPAGLTPERAIDQVWTMTAPEVADRLIRRCGWSLDAYQSWLGDQLRAGFRPVRVK